MNISIIHKIDEGMQKEIDLLLHELSSSLGTIDKDRVNRLLEEGRLTLFAAEDDNGRFTGMLTLTFCPTLTGDKYWIEDVIVHDEFRGHGIGKALVKAAVSHVKQSGQPYRIYLTSNPSRTAARNLYRSEGFEEYDTGVFRLLSE
jgi:GNAT superfamily N-acetyltransferase